MSNKLFPNELRDNNNEGLLSLERELKINVTEDLRTLIPSSWELGGLGSNGSETTVTNSYRSSFIDVSSITRISLENSIPMYRMNLYDTSKKMLRQAPFDITSYSIDPDVAFVRIVVNGTSKTSYNVYSHKREKVGSAPLYITSAAKYNFLPKNDATTNTIAFQRALDAKGTIRIDIPGIYDIDSTLKIDDNTTLEFGAGVFIRRMSSNGYVIVNKGAYTRTRNKNIAIKGMKLLTNGKESNSGSDLITGLRGHLSFFYIDNLSIEDFECLDLGTYSYCIHVCTFFNFIVNNIRVTGKKDAVHLGKGKTFRISNGLFKTFDDPIALNGHDYDTGNPQLGWIEDGIIENCYDMADDSTTGYFARILAGAWKDWTTGMEVQKSDTVVNNGRLYRVVANSDGVKYTSNTAPTHTTGTVTIDGIQWAMIQDDDVTYTAGCRNIHFRNIYLQKNRPTAFSFHFDKDNYSRSYYPGSIAPVQKNIIFENIYWQSTIPTFIGAVTPIDSIKLINCQLEKTSIKLTNVNTAGISYPVTNIVMLATTFKGSGSQELINTANGRSSSVKIVGSIVDDPTFVGTFSTGTTVLVKDI